MYRKDRFQFHVKRHLNVVKITTNVFSLLLQISTNALLKRTTASILVIIRLAVTDVDVRLDTD